MVVPSSNMMVGVPDTPSRSPRAKSSATGLVQLALPTSEPFIAAVKVVLRSAAHHTATARVYEGVSLPAVVLMPVRGQNRYCTAMPCLLNSSMCLCSSRQYAQSTSVNTVTVYFGLGGANTSLWLSSTFASS